jgi:hypothetical protein
MKSTSSWNTELFGDNTSTDYQIGNCTWIDFA